MVLYLLRTSLILGPYAVQSYLVMKYGSLPTTRSESDKHIEVIVAMMQKVEITDSGDTMYLEGDRLDRFEVNLRNDN